MGKYTCARLGLLDDASVVKTTLSPRGTWCRRRRREGYPGDKLLIKYDAIIFSPILSLPEGEHTCHTCPR